MINTIQLLEEAINEEKAAHDRYSKAADQAEDPQTRLLFEQMAREEAMHEKRLRDRLRALKLMF